MPLDSTCMHVQLWYIVSTGDHGVECMKWLRRLYDWVLAWAQKPHSQMALFLLAFAESSFFPVPPDVLLIALVIGLPSRAFRFAAICTAGSVIGGIAGYGIGFGVWELVQNFFFTYIFSREVFDKVSLLYQNYAFWAVFAAGFTPIPYKVFTIAGGVCKINVGLFLVASLISRAGRFFLVAGLLWKFGAPIKVFIDRYFNLLATAFTILLILGFVVIKFFLNSH